ncbi:MFS general substrate transporter [Rhizodiscina lignyota]|uniref:MFS general substrate transporter n=1 Tax=Rhizodiscina lignyota TaxID=1504668 RepID=A0A9P4IKP9_9PEZI|nr:MFS general substrate transporter [Rhizodiscina lignyota]
MLIKIVHAGHFLPEISTEAEQRNVEESTDGIEEQDGGYGWVCVFAMLLITAHTWGVNGSFGVYLAHYLADNTFPGTAETTYSFIGGLSLAQITFIAPLVTKFSAKFGLHPTLFVGIVLETGALIAASFARRVWHLFLTQGLLFGWGSSFLYVGAIGIVPQWFTKRRGVANGIAAAGSGLGGLIYSLAAQAMIQNLGLSWAFRITAICAFAVNSVCALLMRDRNKHIMPNQHSFDLSLLKRYEFLVIIAWAYFSILGYTIIMFSLPDNALKIGLNARQGAIAGALVNLGMALGRPVVGYFSDRVGRINMITGGTFLCGLFCLCIWTSANSYAVLLVFAVLGGTVVGTYWVSIGPLLADLLGIKHLPAALSIIWTAIVLPGTFAEPIALKMRESGSSAYFPVQLFTGFMFIAGTICMLVLRSWKIAQDHPQGEKGALRGRSIVLLVDEIKRAVARSLAPAKV